MERVGGRKEKMEGHFSTDQSPQWAVVPMKEEEEEQEEEEEVIVWNVISHISSYAPSGFTNPRSISSVYILP